MTCCTATACSCSTWLPGRAVSHACRTFGVHRSTYYRWKRRSTATAWRCCGPASGARPRMPNQFSAWSSSGSWPLASAIPGRAGSDQQRAGATEVGRHLVVSPNGVWRVLRRHGLNTRDETAGAGRRLCRALPAAARAAPRAAYRHVDRPGELVGIDCFFVGRLRGAKDPVWQITAIDCYSSYAWADLVTCPTGQPTHIQTSKLARRVAADLARPAGSWNAVSPTTATSFAARLRPTRSTSRHIHHTRIRPGRPQTNGHVERLHKTILDECWRPSFARYLHIRYGGLRRDLDHTSTSTTPTAPTTAASPKAAYPQISSTPPTKCRPRA